MGAFVAGMIRSAEIAPFPTMTIVPPSFAFPVLKRSDQLDTFVPYVSVGVSPPSAVAELIVTVLIAFVS